MPRFSFKKPHSFAQIPQLPWSKEERGEKEGRKRLLLLECSTRHSVLSQPFSFSRPPFLIKNLPFPPLSCNSHLLSLLPLFSRCYINGEPQALETAMEKKEFPKHGLVRLPPGFRFHPTDEELVVQYLRRKALSCPLPAAIIPEIELGKLNPWDLHSGVGGEKYFFYQKEVSKCHRKKERVSNKNQIFGYWKATGKKKPVFAASKGDELVATKQVMVFHRGEPPYGSKTDWTLIEYSLCDNQLLNTFPQSLIASGKEWVVCRIFAKRRSMKQTARNSGMRNGASHRRISPPCPSSPLSCITDGDLSDEECVHGDEALSKNTIA